MAMNLSFVLVEQEWLVDAGSAMALSKDTKAGFENGIFPTFLVPDFFRDLKTHRFLNPVAKEFFELLRSTRAHVKKKPRISNLDVLLHFLCFEKANGRNSTCTFRVYRHTRLTDYTLRS